MSGADATALAPLVLIADDEELVLQLAQDLLTRAGFRVLCARDGIEALSMHAQREAEVALVLLDRSMPVLDGPAVLRELRRRSPQLPVILSSGHGDTRAELADLPGPAPLVLGKPYRGSELIAIVRRALGPP